MNHWFWAKPSPPDASGTWQQLIMLGFWRRFLRHPFPAQVMMLGAAAALLGYGTAAYALFTGLFGSYVALVPGGSAATWFITSIYCSVVPLAAAVLAFTFPPAIAAPSEALASLPLSAAGWYMAQLRRFMLGVGAVTTVTWTSAIFALGHIFRLPLALTLSIQSTQLAANLLVLSVLAAAIGLAVLGHRSLSRQLPPPAFALAMASIMALLRARQNTMLFRWSDYQTAHPALAILPAAAIILALVAAIPPGRRLLTRGAGARPLTVAPARSKANLVARLLPIRGGLAAAIALATLRGLARDRQNLMVLGSAMLIFDGFAVIARLTHSAVFSSLVLGLAVAYVPLFLGLVMIFGRSRLGSRARSIYAKPVPPWFIATVQFITVTVTAAAAAGMLLMVLAALIGGPVAWSQLAGTVAGAAATGGAAYLCGSLMRAHAHDQPAIMGAVIGLVVVQGSEFSLQSALKLSGLEASGYRLGSLVLLGVAAVAVERFVHVREMTHA